MTAAVSHRYRDFGRETSDDPADPSMPPDALEDMRLAAFDSGYQAGWEDAVKAHGEENERTTSAIAQNLQDLSFTHHEAFLKLTAATRPLMDQIVRKLLPDIARRALAAHLLDEISQLMAEHAGKSFQITVAPDQHDEVEAVLKGLGQVPFTLGTDRLLSTGQGYLGVDDQEREIDLDSVIVNIAGAFDAFYNDIQKESDHG